MQTYRIRALPLTSLEMDKSAFTYRFNYGQKIKVPLAAWFIEGADRNILVDTGADAHLATGFRGLPATSIMSFEEALSSIDLKPSDIDIIIQTHLHWDHCANTRKCPNARILVQEEELRFASNPHPVLATSYKSELYEDLDFEVIRGDHKLMPGIELLFTPGHTPGGMSVAVQTGKGKAVITGFCCINDNFETPAGASDEIRHATPVIAPGIHLNAVDGFNSVQHIKDIADLVIANHDPEYLLPRVVA